MQLVAVPECCAARPRNKLDLDYVLRSTETDLEAYPKTLMATCPGAQHQEAMKPFMFPTLHCSLRRLWLVDGPTALCTWKPHVQKQSRSLCRPSRSSVAQTLQVPAQPTAVTALARFAAPRSQVRV